MLELGQLPAIARWLEDLAVSEPAWRGFADHGIRLCLAADLPALKHWLEQASVEGPRP